MSLHVLIPAAGSGRRIGAGVNKQYLELGDRPILAHTLIRLARLTEVDSLTLVVPEAEIDQCRAEIVARYQIDKVAGIVAGGAERQDSVRLGLAGLAAAEDDLVLVHDGVRPFFPSDRIPALVATAREVGAALFAIPAQDTIKEVREGRVERTLDRRALWLVQTPQAFRYATLRDAHRRAHAAGYQGTDDASLVEWCGGEVAAVEGSADNFKITTPADLALARALLNAGEIALT